MRELYLNDVRAFAKRAKGKIDKVYLHWTAGWYEQAFDSYHINIFGDGRVFSSTDDFAEIKSHTWKRNSRAIGISLCCCVGATLGGDGVPDFGECPPTLEQLEACGKIMAILSEELELPMNYNNFKTHAEIAEVDYYGVGSGDPETRWDLYLLYDLGSDDKLKSGGDVLRGKANWYLANGVYN